MTVLNSVFCENRPHFTLKWFQIHFFGEGFKTTGVSLLPLFRTIATGQNRGFLSVNRRLSFEAAPWDICFLEESNLLSLWNQWVISLRWGKNKQERDPVIWHTYSHTGIKNLKYHTKKKKWQLLISLCDTQRCQMSWLQEWNNFTCYFCTIKINSTNFGM